MDVVESWTGRHASALQRATRSTNEAFAGRLGVSVRAVAKWNAAPDMVLKPEMQQVLDTFLNKAPEDAKARFFLIIGQPRGANHRTEPRLVTPVSDLSSLTAWVAESNTSRDAIEQIKRGAESLARAHPNTPAKRLLPEVLRLQRQTQSILQSGKQRLSETRDLYKLNSDLLAHACCWATSSKTNSPNNTAMRPRSWQTKLRQPAPSLGAPGQKRRVGKISTSSQPT